MLVANAASAMPFVDPAGDFIPSFVVPRNPDLDVLTSEVTLQDSEFNFSVRLADPVGTTAGSLYVLGLDRGCRYITLPFDCSEWQEFVAAVDQYIDYCANTERAPNKPYSGTYNVRVSQELYRKAAQCAQRQGITLNELNVRALQAAVDHDGVAKIEHVHKHEIAFADQKIMDPVFATTGIDSPWETFNASAH